MEESEGANWELVVFKLVCESDHMETQDKPAEQASQPLVQQVFTGDHELAFQQVPGYDMLFWFCSLVQGAGCYLQALRNFIHSSLGLTGD